MAPGPSPARPAYLQRPAVRAVLWVLTGIYLALVAALVFTPASDDPHSGQLFLELIEDAHAAGWLPTWLGYDQVEWLANVIMFGPGGFLLTLIFLPARWWPVPLGGLGATLLIEILQLAIPGRVTSALDVLANSLGCVIGWVFALIWVKLTVKPTKTAPMRV